MNGTLLLLLCTAAFAAAYFLYGGLLQRLLGVDPQDALNGTTALHALCLERGADILRVHDVREAVQAVRIVQAMRAQESLYV